MSAITQKLSYSPIEHGSELDTRICFAVGEINRAQLEETAIEAGITYDKWTTDDDLRAEIIDAARNNGGIKIFAVDGGVLTLGFTTDEALPAFHPSGEVPIPARNLPAKPLSELYLLWEKLGNTPVTGDGQYLDEPFLHFEKGSETQAVWHWFESQNSRFIIGEVMQSIRHADDKLKARTFGNKE